MALFKAGVSQTDLSPDKGVDLGGYPYFERANVGIHDPLYGTCLYLINDKCESVLLMTSDLCYMTKRQCDMVKEQVYAKTGILKESIIMTFSHSHSAPWMSAMFRSLPGQPEYESKVDEDYLKVVINKWSDCAKEAFDNIFDASIGFTKTRCGKEQGIGGNRRDPENGLSDEDVPVMVIKDKDNVIRAIHTKYALHPTILHGENKYVSADYPGYIRKHINMEYPDAVFMFSQGTSGNQSPRYFRKDQSFSEAERFGKTIALSILEIIDNVIYTDSLKILHSTRVLELKIRNYSDIESAKAKVEYYKKKKEEKIKNNGSYTEIQTADMWLLGAECEYNYSLMYQKGELESYYKNDIPFTAHGLVLNEHAYTFTQGEMFVEFGLRIKELSPFANTTVITVSNGMTPGYCVTKEAYEEGGYEAWNSLLDTKCGDIVVNSLLDMLTGMHMRYKEERRIG